MWTEDELLWALQDLGKSEGIDVEVGPVTSDLDVIGDPPSSAFLCRRASGSLVIRCTLLVDAETVEAALHELAHAKLGTQNGMDEWPVYEQAAVWALRFPPEVAAQVAKMAQEDT